MQKNLEKQTSAEPAYYNTAFLDSNDGRPLRILSEYIEPLHRLVHEKIHDTIVFFGSARLKENGPLGKYYNDARELAYQLTQWSKKLSDKKRFVICSGGGGGIMEAANRGATDAGGKTIGFSIGLPHEQRPNPYISPSLKFEFHYFFMRKFWFSYLARALIIFPGGFGTLDELFEILTLVQTKKIDRKILILLYGQDYWNNIINFDALVKYEMISPEDLKLIYRVDTVDSAFELLTQSLPQHEELTCPAIAKTKFSYRHEQQE